MNSEAHDNAVGRLAEIIFGNAEYEQARGGGDHLEDLNILRPILTQEVWEDLTLSMDVCPRHVIDLEICLDDFESLPTPGRCPWAEKVIEEREAAEEERQVKQAREQLIEDYLRFKQGEEQ